MAVDEKDGELLQDSCVMDVRRWRQQCDCGEQFVLSMSDKIAESLIDVAGGWRANRKQSIWTDMCDASDNHAKRTATRGIVNSAQDLSDTRKG
jgi:hypothetical protein